MYNQRRKDVNDFAEAQNCSRIGACLINVSRSDNVMTVVSQGLGDMAVECVISTCPGQIEQDVEMAQAVLH